MADLNEDPAIWPPRKSALLQRILGDFEDEDESINRTYESNYLDGSTVPTYEEFTGATAKKLPFKAPVEPFHGSYHGGSHHGFANSTSASMLTRGAAPLRAAFDQLSPVIDNTCSIVSEDEDSEATPLSAAKCKVVSDSTLDSIDDNKENRASQSFLTNDSNHDVLANEFSSLSIKNIDESNISVRRRPGIPLKVPMTLPSKFRHADAAVARVNVILDSPPIAESKAATASAFTPDHRTSAQSTVTATAPANRNYASSLIQVFQKPISSLSKRLFQQTPTKAPLNGTPSMDSSSEYLACENKQIQTSFGASFLEGTQEEERQLQEPQQLQDEFVFKKPADFSGKPEDATSSQFQLRLSSSSQGSSNSDEVPEIVEPPRKSKKKLENLRRSIVAMNSTESKAKIDVKKRVSMCSVGLPKQLIDADETILDELENDDDEKNGFIFTLYTSAIEEEIEEPDEPGKEAPRGRVNIMETSDESEPEEDKAAGHEENADKTNYTAFENFLIQHTKKKVEERPKEDSIRSVEESPSILEVEAEEVGRSSLLNESSDEQPVAKPARKKKTSDEDSDDAFERFLREQREKAAAKVKAPVVTKKKMDSFIVDDDEEEEEVASSEVESDDRKKTVQKKEIITISSSSSDEEKDEDDPHLFYIRTTKKISEKTKPIAESTKIGKKGDSEKPKTKTTKAKKPVGRSSLLDGSSSSDESIVSVKSTSSLDTSSSSMDDSFKRRFTGTTRRTAPQFDPTEFRTPTTKHIPVKDSRLVKTQATKKGHYEPVRETKKYSFIDSFTTSLDNDRKDEKALHYVKGFKKKAVRVELLQRMYAEFNKHAFENKLPEEMKISWSKRLTSTAGFCRSRITPEGHHWCSIEISEKICDTAERLRDTLAHEMCHAACHIINKRPREMHGRVWKSWTYQVNAVFRHMPPIEIYHSYAIKKKFTYKCTNCPNQIHRHSKSIDVNKQGCGLCHGRFVLVKNDDKAQPDSFEDRRFDRVVHGLDDADEDQTCGSEYGGLPDSMPPQTPKTPSSRAPNKFAQFVKDNYNSVKKEKNLASHKDVMQELSKNFKSLSTK